MSDISSLFVLLFAGLVPSLFVLARNRELTDPRVVFGCGYTVFTGAPVVWYLWSGYYYHGMSTEMIPLVLLSCASAIVAFSLGASLALRKRTSRHEPVSDPRPTIIARQVSAGYHLLVIFLLVCLGVYGSSAILMRRGAADIDFKSDILVTADSLTIRLYYISAVAIIVGAIALVCYDSWLRRGRTGRIVWFVLGAFGFFGLLHGERDVALPVAAWILANLRFPNRRRIAVVSLCLLLLLAVVPVARQAGYAMSAQVERASEMSVEGVFESLATKSSPNLFVFTKVSSWIPRHYRYSYGQTYVDALLSFVPWHEEARQRSLLAWFRNEYAPRGVSGYGFALDAEAYMNFGWLGPPLFFFAWGVLLGALYSPGASSLRSPSHLYYSIFPLVISLFSIRSDFRGFSKMMVFGLALMFVLQPIASMIARSTRVGSRMVEQPLPRARRYSEFLGSPSGE